MCRDVGVCSLGPCSVVWIDGMSRAVDIAASDSGGEVASVSASMPSSSTSSSCVCHAVALRVSPAFLPKVSQLVGKGNRGREPFLDGRLIPSP